ncbi:MAG TPA: hypothetical protein VIU87_13480, partial [Mycobacterium sp.]
FLGRLLAHIYEMVDFEPDHRLVMRTANGPSPDGDCVHLEVVRDGRDENDTAQSGQAGGLLVTRGARGGACDAAGHGLFR